MNKKFILSSLLCGTLALTGCTDLGETLYSDIPTIEYGKTDEEIATIVGGAYSTLRGYGSGTDEGNGVNCYPTCEYVFFLLECSSDEACIPTRGTDWYDGGRYQQWQYHKWTPQNDGMTALWRYAFTGVSKTNATIYQVENSGLSEEALRKVKAQLRGLRAYYYTQLVDQFGNVPINTKFEYANEEEENEQLSTKSRKEVFDFIVSELNDVLPDLPAKGYGIIDQGVANALLARMYLNAKVYTGKEMYQECLDACDRIKGYSLTGDYSASFATKNETSPEIILAIPYDHSKGTVGNYLASMSYHYNQKYAFDPNGVWQWSGNGICAQPGIWSSYEEGDVRRDKTLLIGQQKSAKDGSDVMMDNGEPLNYTEDIVTYHNALQNEGARLNKYEVQATDQWERDNDWVLIRYAEVLMMQAEANYRLGNSMAALGYLNQIRNRAGLTGLNVLDDKALEAEWLHEFCMEGLRRTVSIRFGTFGNKGFDGTPWPATMSDDFNGAANVADTDKHWELFAIPAVEMEKNPRLVQNDGYR